MDNGATSEQNGSGARLRQRGHYFPPMLSAFGSIQAVVMNGTGSVAEQQNQGNNGCMSTTRSMIAFCAM